MTFKTFLKNKISATQFEALHEILNVSKKKLTMMLDVPERIDIDNVRQFASLTGENAAYLVDTFNCGKQTITVDELEELRTEVTVSSKGKTGKSYLVNSMKKFSKPSKVIRA